MTPAVRDIHIDLFRSCIARFAPWMGFFPEYGGDVGLQSHARKLGRSAVL